MKAIHLGALLYPERIQFGLLLAVKAQLRAKPSQRRLFLPGKVTEIFTFRD